MLRQTIRSLARNPRFTVLAVLTLALGIGSNTAMFSLINSILIKPLAYRDPDRLIAISTNIPKLNHLYPSIPVSAYYATEWRKQARCLEAIALLRQVQVNFTGREGSERVIGVAASTSLFSMLGVSPQAGRAFLADEDVEGKNRVVILSDGFWKRRFAGDLSALGSSIELNGRPHQVVGIMPEAFPFPKGNELHSMMPVPERTDLWLPLTVRREETQRMVNHNYAAIARLGQGVSISAATAEFNGILRSLPGMPSKDFEVRVQLSPLQTEMTRRVRQGLIVLMLAVGSVLLIVCVNITSLLLTRGAGRNRELAVRTALGASRLQLCLMLLTDSLVLSMTGTAGGIIAAYWLVDAVRLYLPVGLPRIEEVSVDFTALLFACGLTCVCTVACGLIPAWRLSTAVSTQALKDGGRGTLTSRGAGRLRSVLIAGEVAVCVVLLVSAGLLINSFVRIAGIEQGFRSSNVFVAEADLPAARYSDSQARLAFFRQVLERGAALPGMQAIGAASKLPLTGVSEVVSIVAEGDPTPATRAPHAEYRIVTPGYFAAMSTPLLSGRIFDDRPDGLKVAVIGESTAKRIWPGEYPIGRQFRGYGDGPITVVGVVASVRSTTLNSEPPLTVYLPMAQHPRNSMTFVMRTASGHEPDIRQAVKEVDPQLPLSRIAKVDEIVASTTASRRIQLMILSGFAGVALFLAYLGIFGVVSAAVAQRRPELGLRLALGAQTNDVMRLVLRDGMRPVIAGAIAGLLAALASMRLISSMLYGVTPSDPLTYSLAAASLLVVAAFACWLPARGVLRIDPIATLRAE